MDTTAKPAPPTSALPASALPTSALPTSALPTSAPLPLDAPALPLEETTRPAPGEATRPAPGEAPPAVKRPPPRPSSARQCADALPAAEALPAAPDRQPSLDATPPDSARAPRQAAPPPLPGAADDESAAGPPPVAAATPWQQFLERGGPILAVERGVNPRSRMLLAALAKSVGLADSQFEQALLALQGGKLGAAVERTQTEIDFRAYLANYLRQERLGFVTATLESRAVRWGQKHYGLGEAQAAQAIKEVVAELGLKSVSPAQAEQYLLDVLRQKAGDSAWVDAATGERLRVIGRQWGLTDAEIDAILQRHTSRNVRKQRNERLFVGALLTLVGLLLAGFVGFVVWRVSRKPGAAPLAAGANSVAPTALKGGVAPADADAAPAAIPSDKGGEAAVPAAPVKSPDWWTEALEVQAVSARLKAAEFIPLHDELRAADPEARGAAYRKLASLHARLFPDREKMRVLHRVSDSLAALEPDADAAAALLAGWREAVLPAAPAAPKDPRDYERSFRVLASALQSLSEGKLPAERAAAWAAEFGAALDAPLDPAAPAEDLKNAAFAGLAAAHYRRLAKSAGDNPAAFQKHYEILAEFLGYIPDHVIESLDFDYLVAVLPKAGADWVLYRDLLLNCVASDNPGQLAKLVNMYEKLEAGELRDALSALFTRAFLLDPRAASPTEIVAALREKFALPKEIAPKTEAERLEIARKLADAALAKTPGAAASDAELLQQTIDLAHCAALACSLALREPGHVVFDELLANKAPRLADLKAPDAEADGLGSRKPIIVPPRDFEKVQLQENIHRLAGGGRTAPTDRAFVLGTLANLADKVPDLHLTQAETLANYVLGAEKEPDELERLLTALVKIGRWRAFRLALADGLETSRLPREQLERVLGSVLGVDTPLAGGAAGKALARERLLRSVLVDLRVEVGVGAAPPTPTENDLDKTARALDDLYRHQAKLHGLPSEAWLSAPTSGLLRLLIHQRLGALNADTLAPADQRFVADWPRQQEVIDYLAPDEPRRVLLLQRAWLRTLAIVRKTQAPAGDKAAADKADALVADLARADGRHPDVLRQLREGEAALLRAWLALASAN